MKERKRIALIVAAIVTGMVLTVPAVAREYDLVILNGRVMDPETGCDAVANVGVKDGRIAAITAKKITGSTTIDATGHMVSHGFIDIHAHGQNNGDTRVQVIRRTVKTR